MKNLFVNWKLGLSFLIEDTHISFYTFFTLIFAECSYLWVFHETSVALPITGILIGYILNLMLFAWLKGTTEGTILEKIFSILYVIIFVVLFVIGCVFNMDLCIICSGIVLGVTSLWIIIKNQQYTFPHLCNKFLFILPQIIIIAVPFIAFTICFAMIPFIPIALKIIIPLLYLMLSPYIAYFEDVSAACNIFELAYDITWSKEQE